MNFTLPPFKKNFYPNAEQISTPTYFLPNVPLTLLFSDRYVFHFESTYYRRILPTVPGLVDPGPGGTGLFPTFSRSVR